MNYSKKISLVYFLLFCLSFLTFGCATPSHKIHPEFETRSKKIATANLIPPDIKIYELSAGGVQELRDDWSAIGKENVITSLTETLNEEQIEIKTTPLDKETEEEMEEIQALYKAVNDSILLHLYNGQALFPEKQKNFDYSIGPIDNILQLFNADSLILVYGIDQISTGGRKALMAAGIIAGAFTGVVIMPSAGATVVSLALIDSSGTILWYNYQGIGGSYDLRDSDSCKKFIQKVVSDFPKLKKGYE